MTQFALFGSSESAPKATPDKPDESRSLDTLGAVVANVLRGMNAQRAALCLVLANAEAGRAAEDLGMIAVRPALAAAVKAGALTKAESKRVKDGIGQLATDAERDFALSLTGAAVIDRPKAPAKAKRKSKGRAVTKPADVPVVAPLERFVPSGNAEGQSVKAALAANLDALRTLNSLVGQPTQAQREALAGFCGWGGLAGVFPDANGNAAKGFEQASTELTGLLTADDYRDANQSILSGYYTPKALIEYLYAVVARMGFKGGRVLEPACGTGRFIGYMPEQLRADSMVFGVERDTVTARIAKALYGESLIVNAALEDTASDARGYDLIIGNPPYSDSVTTDVERSGVKGLKVHAYFLARSLLEARDGALVAFVVTSNLLDSMSDDFASWLTSRSDLMAAVRLPNRVFQDGAGTNVCTDLLVWRKRDDAKPHANALPFREKYKEPITGAEINGVFAVGKGGVLVGQPIQQSGPWGDRFGLDAGKQWVDALPPLSQFPRDVASEPLPIDETERPLSVPDGVESGCYFHVPGVGVAQATVDMSGERVGYLVGLQGRREQRAVGMMRVRDAALAVIAAESDGASDGACDKLRVALNTAYDAFVKKHGFVNSAANVAAFSDDLHLPLVMALEVDYDKGVSKAVAKTTGEAERPASANKASIFTQRVVSAVDHAAGVESPEDALAASLSRFAEVDLDYMSGLLGVTPESVAGDLEGLIAYDPEKDAYVPMDEYLSGDIQSRIDALTNDPRCHGNEKRLREALPVKLVSKDIDVQFGAPWIAPRHFEQFINELLQVNGKGFKLGYNPVLTEWAWSERGRVLRTVQTSEWGTSRADAVDIVLNLMNNRPTTVWDSDGDRRWVNQDETALAAEKADAIKDAFDAWIWRDADRRDELEGVYNAKFNRVRNRKWNGAHMRLPGKVADSVIEFSPLQKAAVWRGVVQNRTLLDCSTGFGKTFVMTAIAMELKRLGMARKNLIATENHLVAQFAAEVKRLYPLAKVLAVSEKAISKRHRAATLSLIATTDFDIVVIGHSAMERMPLPTGYVESYCERKVKDIVDAQAEMDAMEGMDGRAASRARRKLQKMKEQWEGKLKRLTQSKTRYNMVDLGQMGIDNLLFDESQAAKNSSIVTKMSRISGMGNTEGSQFAANFGVMAAWLSEKTGGRGLIMATATPIANSIAETFTVLNQLSPETLKDMGIDNFDSWAALFARVDSDYELDGTGQRYALRSRLRRFVNVPELQTLWHQFTQTVTKADVAADAASRGEPAPEPPIRGGKMRCVTVQPCRVQQAFMEKLVERAGSCGNGSRKDNFLAITHDARLASIDIRLIDPAAPESPDSKIKACVRDCVAEYKRYNEFRGTQMIFLDQGTPTNAPRDYVPVQPACRETATERAIEKIKNEKTGVRIADRGSFSPYYAVRDQLVAAGIPAKEIVFAHDFRTSKAKAVLYAKLNAGLYRFVIGSTPLLGKGVNAQQRLTAVRGLDFPWRPDEVEQRIGRGIRRDHRLYEHLRDLGTEFGVDVTWYATERTYDARNLQTLEVKAAFIGQFRSGKVGRTVEVESDEATYEALKAATTGNPLFVEELKARQEVRKLESSKRAFNRNRDMLAWRIRSNNQRIEQLENRITNLAADIAHRDKGHAAASFAGRLAGSAAKWWGQRVSNHRGFTVSMVRETGKLCVNVEGSNTYYDSLGFAHVDFREAEVEQLANALIDGLEGCEQSWIDAVADCTAEIAASEAEMLKEWSKQGDLDAARREHRRLVDLLMPANDNGKDKGEAAAA